LNTPHCGYLTKQEQVPVFGVADLIIRSLLNREQFSDPFGIAERLGISSALWPLFGLLWPSGAHLAARIATRPVLATERILELGCGLGLSSLTAHRRGADVTASDCHPLAEAFLLENIRLNNLPPIKYWHSQWGVDAFDKASPQCEAEALDAVVRELRVSNSDPGQFDLIIASDVLYERDPAGNLAEFISTHAKKKSEIWVVDPDRGNRSAFNRHMRELEFTARELRLDQSLSLDSAAYKGCIMLYRRGAHAANVSELNASLN
jgi:predicted nicotinamide N-methyase